MIDISSTGLTVTLIASTTYPSGITITQFADDGDSFDFPELTIAEKAMDINGGLVTWSKPSAIDVTMNIVPSSDDDVNLTLLGDMNRVGKGRRSALDEITIVVVYGDGTTKTLSGGKMTKYMPSGSATSAGRLKSKSFGFTFEDIN